MLINKKLIFVNLITACALNVFGWGQKGHDIVAYVAQKHLTPAAEAKVDSLLNGYSLVYWANWMDNASHSPEYSYTKTWHYKNIDETQSFEEAPDIPEGNIVNALNEQIEILADSGVSAQDKALALKMVTHFMGDIHQPMHLGRASDRGGNSHKVRFFNKPTNLHSVWDTDILEAGHAWTHTEWQTEIDRLSPETQTEFLMNGNPASWGKETYALCKDIYESTPIDTNIEYDYIAKWTPVIENQLLKGGLRLADVLNSVFDPSYVSQNLLIEANETK